MRSDIYTVKSVIYGINSDVSLMSEVYITTFIVGFIYIHIYPCVRLHCLSITLCYIYKYE